MADGLCFGVFPLGLAGGPEGVASGPPDDYDEIGKGVERLRGDGPPLLVRMYVEWAGAASSAKARRLVSAFATSPLEWDLVLAYRDPEGTSPRGSHSSSKSSRSTGTGSPLFR